WFKVDEVSIVGEIIQKYHCGQKPDLVPEIVEKRLGRMKSAMGMESSSRLWNSTVAILGAGGTGSAAAHSLARSCIGRIILVDFDVYDFHNSERGHGCEEAYLLLAERLYKVDVMKRFINKINPSVEVIAIVGNLLNKEVYDLVIQADVVIGATDSHH